jgi:hypothetical protein
VNLPVLSDLILANRRSQSERARLGDTFLASRVPGLTGRRLRSRKDVGEIAVSVPDALSPTRLDAFYS